MTSDIDDVIRQETRRGKRPIDIETRRQHAKIVKGLSWLKEQGATEADAVKFIVSELELRPEGLAFGRCGATSKPQAGFFEGIYSNCAF